MKQDLRLKAYKIQLTHGIKDADTAQRLAYADRFQSLVDEDKDFLDKLIMSDEAHFQLDGYVNRQNFRCWGTENPKSTIPKNLQPKKLTVWCSLTSKKIIGPYYFEDEEGKTLTINGNRYREMIETFLIPEVQGKERLRFQQDGAPPHQAKETIELLKTVFGNRIISQNCDFKWPARSPDLTPMNFFLWGYLKDRVYKNRPKTLDNLKYNIDNKIMGIGEDTLKRVMQAMLDRAMKCKEAGGKHLDDVIFHT
uniref:DDE_3 domain-containing protein n=1 Tax=Strongyloides stercoralis TaxID=6248 RepID=A0A0K0EGX0_STRER